LSCRKIGRGSFGEVFKVKAKTSGEKYAIKKIKMTDENILIQEVAISTLIQTFDSDSVVQYVDFWFEREDKSDKAWILFIQMELCEKTLEDIIKELGQDLSTKNSGILTDFGYFIASELFIEILEGVKFLHERQIIHRDLKPGNILLNRGVRGRFIKIADFGLAKVLESESNTKDRGSIKYMAPEVIDGKYDIKADIYSLGVIMQQLFFIDVVKYEQSLT